MSYQIPLVIKYGDDGLPVGLTESNEIFVSAVSATTLIVNSVSAASSNITADLDQFAFALNTEDFTGSPLTVKKVTFSPPSGAAPIIFNSGTVVSLAQDGSGLEVVPESNVTHNNLNLHLANLIGVNGNNIHWHLSTLNSYYVNTSGDTMTGALNTPAVSTPFISGVDYIQFDTAVESQTSEGRITWDNTFKTLIVGTAAGSIFRLGQEVSMRVRNKTGDPLYKGNVVYVSGAETNLPTVALASASSEGTTHKAMGILKEDIPNNNQGLMMLQGKIFNLNTSAYSAGEVLYLGTTPGSFTTTYAAAPNHPELIGAVVESDATNGSILVSIQHGYEINELHNVSRTPASATGQILVWNETEGYYAPQYQTEQVTINFDNVSANDYRTIGKFKYGHNIERIDTVLAVTGGSPSINWSVNIGEDRTVSETTVSGTCSSNTTGATLSTNTNITADYWVWVTVDSIDAPVKEFTLTLHLRKTE